MVTHCPAFTGLYSFFLNILRPCAIRACVCVSSVLCYGVVTCLGSAHWNRCVTDWTYLFLPSEFLCQTLPFLLSLRPLVTSECLDQLIIIEWHVNVSQSRNDSADINQTVDQKGETYIWIFICTSTCTAGVWTLECLMCVWWRRNAARPVRWTLQTHTLSQKTSIHPPIYYMLTVCE